MSSSFLSLYARAYSASPVEEATDIDAGIQNFFGLCALADVVPVTDNSADQGCGWTTPLNADGTPGDRTNATLIKKFDDWVGVDYTKADRGRTTITSNGKTLDVGKSWIIRNLVWALMKRPRDFIKLSQILQYWYDNPGEITFGAVNSDNLYAYKIPVATTTSSATESATETATESATDSAAEATESATETTTDEATTTAPKVKRTVSPTGVSDENGDYPPVAAESNVAGKGNLELESITCTDNQYRPRPLNGSAFSDFLDQYNQKSKYAGEMSVQLFWSCAPWVTTSKFPYLDTDRFANIVTSPSPILFVQTTYDPVTPAKSGRAAHGAFTNSYYVESNGAGVSTIYHSMFHES